jgi:hypothetical protein
MIDSQFDGLTAIVQYRRKPERDPNDCWRNMAAFDVRHVAEGYALSCAKSDDWPWEYQVIDVTGAQ